MNKERKTISWILIAAIVAVAGTALVVTTLASSQPETTAPAPAPTAQGSALPSVLPSPSAAPQTANRVDDTANASVIGYGGPVLVRLTLDADGAISGLDVGGARFSETEGVGSRVKDDAFTQTFIGKKPPLTLGEDVDGVAGATISSQAAVDAVNEAAAFLTETPADTK